MKDRTFGYIVYAVGYYAVVGLPALFILDAVFNPVTPAKLAAEEKELAASDLAEARTA